MANTKSSLTFQNTQTYPSNTSGSITANAVKSFNNNFINAVATLGDTNVFTEPQIFGNTVQVNSNVTANNFIGPLIGTASWAVNALTASSASSTVSSSYAVSASYALSASYAQTSVTASHALNADLLDGKDSTIFATTGSNTFNGTNTFTGSLNAQSASITYLTVDTIISSSTINNSGSNQLGDAANDTQTLWGTVNLPSGPLTVTGSVGSTGGFTGSLQGTSSWANNASNAISSSYALVATSASYASSSTSASFAISASWAPFVATNTGSLLTTASVSLNTITFTKGDGSTFPITVNTGSGGGGGGMNLGANTFTGSQTIQSASIFLQASSSVALNTNFFTASTAGTTDGANVLMFPGSAQSGSFIFSGSRNVATINPLTNAQAATNRGGGNFNGNFGVLSSIYSTASAVPIFSNNVLLSGVTTNIANTSSVTTLSANFVGGNITVTGSALSAVNISQNNIDSVNIINDFTSSTGVSQQVSIQGNLIKGGATGGTVLAQIKFAGTGSSSNTRQFINNIMFGASNTASLEATGTALQNMLNTAVIGSNLIVSGTMNSNSLSGSMFVGQFNEQTATYAPADPSTVKFAVGTGTTSAARRTSFQVFNNGDIVASAAGGGISGRGHSLFTASAAAVVNATVNAGTQVGVYNGSFVTNGGSIAGGNAAITTAIIAGESNTISAGRSSATVAASYNTINTSAGADTNNIIAGAFSSQISGSTSKYTGIFASTGSTINEGINSAIIAANNARLSNTTGSVALGRDTAYTGSANYTLYTQNVNLSGSLTVNNNLQYNFGEFWSSASVTPAAGVSQSVVFDSTGMAAGMALSGSGALIKITNAGTYNIQFSAQVNTSAGADTMYMWFKKNGANIATSNSKVVLANNTAQLMTVNILDNAAANDYYEIAYQSNNGNAQILSEAASGNLPAIPGVILTLTQVK